MSDSWIYSKSEQKKVDDLKRQISRLELQQTALHRKIEEIESGQSPIKPGQFITCESYSRIRKGLVKAVRTSYRGFEYYCHIIANDGRVIGTANVDSLKCPVLDIEKEAARKNAMPKANQRKKRTKQLGD